LSKQGKIIVLSGSSGAGKTTLMHALCDYFKSSHPLDRVITYTTRAVRPGEADGIDYYFVSQEQFEQKIQEGFFLEWSLAYGCYYGSPYSLIKNCQEGMSSIAILDRSGVQRLLSLCPEYVVSVWISVEYRNLEARLKARATEDEASYNRRLQLAQQEGEQERQNPLFSYNVPNDLFGDALKRLIEIVIRELEIL